MKKLILLDIRSGYGGAEKYFDNLCEDLNMHTDLNFQKVVFDMNQINKFNLYRKLLTMRNSTIVFNMSVLGIGLFYLLLLKIGFNKLILYPHVVVPHSVLQSKLSFIRDINRWFCLKISSYVVAISDGNYKILKQIAPMDKLFIVYNYIRKTYSFSAASLSNKEFAIIGRFQNKHKKQVEFLECSHNFIKQTNIVIHLFGDGPDRNKIEKIIKQNQLEQNVILHGWISEEEIFQFRYSTVLSLSEWEGLPLNLLESFANNRMVLGRRIDGVEELLYGNFLFNTYEELMGLMLKAIQGQFESDIIFHNKKYINEKYQIDKSLTALKHICEKLIK